MKEEILETKRKLYLLLMKLNEDIITEREVGIMFSLSKGEVAEHKSSLGLQMFKLNIK